jgi:hypothetical protein
MESPFLIFIDRFAKVIRANCRTVEIVTIKAKRYTSGLVVEGGPNGNQELASDLSTIWTARQEATRMIEMIIKSSFSFALTHLALEETNIQRLGAFILSLLLGVLYPFPRSKVLNRKRINY